MTEIDELIAEAKELNVEKQTEDKLFKQPPSIQIAKEVLTTHEFRAMCHSIVANHTVRRPIWFKCRNFKPAQLVILRINCANDEQLDADVKFKFVSQFFNNQKFIIDNLGTSVTYWDSLLSVNVSASTRARVFLEQRKDPLREFRSDGNTKLALLATFQNMVCKGYPPFAFKLRRSVNVASVMPTKECYLKVTNESPIFVLDCEMCVTKFGGSELARVTLIDENGKTLIDTFVKPHNEITDYVTCFSGITKEALNNVSIRLEDVQRAFKRLLPSDAILCGHAIENDLRALRLSHPYCIDIGFAYRLFSEKPRNSLRELAYYFLNETIQASDAGHCSYEDAWTTLRLLKLKLKNGIEFGNVNLGFKYLKWAEEQGFDECAKLYAKVSEGTAVEDFAKQLRKVTLPKPREVGKCLMCETFMMSQCYIETCQCSVNVVEYCCLCVAKDVGARLICSSRYFDFQAFLSEFEAFRYRPSLQEVLDMNEKSGKVMVARFPKKKQRNESSKNIQHFNMASLNSVKKFNEQTLDNKLHEYELCFLELDVPVGVANANEFMEAVYKRVAINGLFGCLFCSSRKSVLYLNVKSK